MYDPSSIPLAEYQALERRRTPTLVRWWHLVNNGDWPKEIPHPPTDERYRHERSVAVLNAIAAIIGERWIVKNRPEE